GRTPRTGSTSATTRARPSSPDCSSTCGRTTRTAPATTRTASFTSSICTPPRFASGSRREAARPRTPWPGRDPAWARLPGVLLEGKKVLVTGVLTPQSIAFDVARVAQQQGADVVLTGFGRAK